jgi:outer membrane lipoprotein SlyB
MGLFGAQIGKSLGKMGGNIAGGLVGGLIGGKKGRAIGSKIGGDLGSTAGAIGGASLTAFKNGGKVKKTGIALVHKDEFVLPKSVKPTIAQKKAVAKLHKNAKSKK